jgi:hypothetical protein
MYSSTSLACLPELDLSPLRRAPVTSKFSEVNDLHVGGVYGVNDLCVLVLN